MRKTKTGTYRALTECSIMVALSTVLSILRIIELPYGGSVTACAMLPIVIAVYRHGGIYGIGVAAANSLIQFLLGMNNLAYAFSWQAAVAIVVFDYVLAFSVFALSGVFKKMFADQRTAVLLGALLASVLRYACHVIVGCTVWAGISIPTSAALLYSLSYNATYMIPETLILLIGVAYCFSVLDFRYPIPKRIIRRDEDKITAVLIISAGICVLIGLVTDVVLVFSHLQNEESGEFDLAGITGVNLTAIIIVSAVCLATSAILIIAAKLRERKMANNG